MTHPVNVLQDFRDIFLPLRLLSLASNSAPDIVVSAVLRHA